MKISIITINYNNIKGLEATFNSIINQSYENIEYLVIDGASNDGSEIFIKNNKLKINFWLSEEDNGIYHAMNKGIANATGDYILFVNSGDVLIDDRVIENVVRHNLNKDLVYGNIILSNGVDEKEWIVEDKLTFETLYKDTIPHPGTFIKRDLFDEIGLYNEQNKIVSDWEFFLLAICKFNCSYKHINLIISKFFLDGLSAKPENYPHLLKERNQVLEKHFPYFIHDYKNYFKVKEELRKVKTYVKLKKTFKKIFSKR